MHSEAMLELRSLGGYLWQSSEPLALISMMMIYLLCLVTVTVTEGATPERAMVRTDIYSLRGRKETAPSQTVKPAVGGLTRGLSTSSRTDDVMPAYTTDLLRLRAAASSQLYPDVERPLLKVSAHKDF